MQDTEERTFGSEAEVSGLGTMDQEAPSKVSVRVWSVPLVPVDAVPTATQKEVLWQAIAFSSADTGSGAFGVDETCHPPAPVPVAAAAVAPVEASVVAARVRDARAPTRIRAAGTA
jgi:hypothetical protein